MNTLTLLAENLFAAQQIVLGDYVMGARGTGAGNPTRRAPRGKKQPGFLQSWGWESLGFGLAVMLLSVPGGIGRGFLPHISCSSKDHPLQSHWCLCRGHGEHPVQAGPVIPARNVIFPPKTPSGNTHPAAMGIR